MMVNDRELVLFVQGIIATQIGKQPDEILEDALFASHFGMDSLDSVELVSELEEWFNLTILDKDVQTLTTVREVVDYLKKRGVTQIPVRS